MEFLDHWLNLILSEKMSTFVCSYVGTFIHMRARAQNLLNQCQRFMDFLSLSTSLGLHFRSLFNYLSFLLLIMTIFLLNNVNP